MQLGTARTFKAQNFSINSRHQLSSCKHESVSRGLGAQGGGGGGSSGNDNNENDEDDNDASASDNAGVNYGDGADDGGGGDDDNDGDKDYVGDVAGNVQKRHTLRLAVRGRNPANWAQEERTC